jgi:hypothetical protein
MRAKRLILLILSLSLLVTSCDNEFYLSEKEFHSLRGQIATADVANMVFGQLRGQVVQINFDNSVSPPRIRNSNLAPFLRSHVPTLGILEGFPSYALSVDRVSSEIERQFDNWLSEELRLFSGPNNTEVRIERVEAMRVQFLDNPNFTFSDDKIAFETTTQIAVDCRIRIAINPVLSRLRDPINGINGTYNVTITTNNMRLRGEASFGEIGSSSNVAFKLTPTPGSVTITDRAGSSTSQTIKNSMRDFISRSLAIPIEKNYDQRYDFFALSNCGVKTEFRCHYEQRPEPESTDTHAVFRGSDNRLYWAMRRDAIWSNYTQIKADRLIGRRRETLSFTADPAIARSTDGTLELAAVSQNGGLYYSQYKDGWKNGRYLREPSVKFRGHKYIGRPAVVAGSAGVVDVVVARANGTLVHLRRSSAAIWSEPTVLQFPSGRTYRDPVIVSASQRIFLAAVGSDDRIYTMVFDLQTSRWSQSDQPFPSEYVKYAPAIAASGNRQIDMVYVGRSGVLWHRVFTLSTDNIRPNIADSGVSYGRANDIGFNTTSTPTLVVTGYRQLDLVARGTNNLLRHKHFTGPSSPIGFIEGVTINGGWSGWRDMNRNFYGTRLLVADATEDFAAASKTATGKVELVARLRANTWQQQYRLHHNGFNAMSFGRQPWKTVHWRGFQKVGDPAIVGRPAIAVL